MEVIKSLIIRLRHTGVLFLAGILLIVYIALGFLYFQQGAQQKSLEEEITKLSLIVTKPLAGGEELQKAYDNVTQKLAPIPDSEAIAKLVGIAEKSGIDVSDDADKFSVPPVTFSQTKVGGGKYQVLSFRKIYVQGDNSSVMAFISDLDSGTTLETMVLKGVNINQISEEPGADTVATVDVDIYTKPKE